MSSGRLGIGFIGSGFITRFHIQSMVGVREADVVGVWSPNGEHAETAAALACDLDVGTARAYASIEAIAADPAIDAIWLCGLNHTRVANRDAICGALTGRPYLTRAAEKHSGPHMPWFWRGDLQGGGVLNDMMCHSIEVKRHLLTAPGAQRASIRPRRITGHIASLKWTRPAYSDKLRRAMGETSTAARTRPSTSPASRSSTRRTTARRWSARPAPRGAVWAPGSG
jgi:predicted dehydrogenase